MVVVKRIVNSNVPLQSYCHSHVDGPCYGGLKKLGIFREVIEITYSCKEVYLPTVCFTHTGESPFDETN